MTRGFRSKSARKKLKIRKLLNKGLQKSAIFADLLNKNLKKFPQETLEMHRFCGKPQSLVTLLLIGSRDGKELDSNLQTHKLARVFLLNWELDSHSSHPAVGYSYDFSLAGHTNAALALKVHLLLP